MKKKFLSALAIVLSVSLMSIQGVQVEAMNQSMPDDGRQCCSKMFAGPDGSVIELTACAGWFLSNNASAMTRACAKVDEAAGSL